MSAKNHNMTETSTSATNQDQAKSFAISDNTEVYYPQAELDDLRMLLELNGFRTEIKKATGIAYPTIHSVSKNGKGTNRVVKALREYVANAKELMNKQ